MGSKKKKSKNKPAVSKTQKAKKVDVLFSQYVIWIIAGGVAVLSFVICIMAKHSALFSVILSLVNGTLGLIAAEYLREKDVLPPRLNILEQGRTWVLLSGLLSAMSVLLMYINLGIYPFGDLTVASGDMFSQYIPFAILRNQTVLSGNPLTYSESLGLGGNLWSVLAYQSNSPFMIFSLFVDAKNMDMFMFILQIIKVGVAGSAFAYFYTEKFERKDVSAAVFSVAYSLMSFSVSNMLNIIWMDCIMLLPLIILGAERVMQNKSAALYVICLAWAIISSYYIGYMICIYLVIYYIAYNVMHTEKFNLSEQVKNLIRFAAISLMSVGMAAVIIIPSALAISSAATHVYEGALDSLLSYNPLKLAARFLWGSEVSYLNQALPNVYCSLFVPVLAVFFLTCGKIPRRKKLTLSVVSSIMMLSTIISYVDYVWHGLHITSGMPFRYSFLISFTLLLMACEVAQHTEEIGFNQITAVICGFAAVILAVYFFDSDSGINMLIVSMIMLMLYVALIATEFIGVTGRNFVMATALLLVFSEMTFSGANIVGQIRDFNGYTAKTYYNSIFDINEKLIDDIKVSDSDIYRIDDEYDHTLNQSIYLNYSSLSYYATPNNGGMLNLMDSLGYASDTINKYNFNIYMPFSDSVLNLKYILSADDSDRNYLELTDISNYGKNVYRNTLALPRAFAVSEDLLEWNVSEPNPFIVQNSLAKLAAGTEGNVYELLTEQNADESSDGDFIMNGNFYAAEYVLPRDGDVFCFFDCRKSKSILIEFAGKTQTLSGDISCIVPLAGGKKGDKLTITFFGESGIKGFVSAALLNDEVLKDSISVMAESPMNFTEYQNGKISGEINVEKDCLLFTSIPYDKGWSVTVNGEKADTEALGSGLLGVKLSQGNNVISMNYKVRGFGAGVTVTVISLAAFALYLFCWKKGIDVAEIKQIINNIRK